MLLNVSVTMVAGLAVTGLVLSSAGAEEEGPQPENKVRLAQLRAVPEKWNIEANFQVFLKLLEEADAHDPDIVITCEGWLDGYASPDKASTPERLRGVAQDLHTSPYLRRVSIEAKERKLFICFGFTSLEDDKIYNAAGLWGPDGKLIGVYHKTHIQTHDHQYSPGQGLPVWLTPWGPVGIMICADRRWPETARTLRLQGARLILNPTYGFFNEFNEAMMRTRSFENQCFIAFTHPQQSLVTNPKGRIIANEQDDGPAVCICDIDLSESRDDNHIRDRRPDLYGIITRTD